MNLRGKRVFHKETFSVHKQKRCCYDNMKYEDENVLVIKQTNKK